MNNLPKITNWAIIKKDVDEIYLIGDVNGEPITEKLIRIDFAEHTASTETEIYELVD